MGDGRWEMGDGRWERGDGRWNRHLLNEGCSWAPDRPSRLKIGAPFCAGAAEDEFRDLPSLICHLLPLEVDFCLRIRGFVCQSGNLPFLRPGVNPNLRP
jgi:hypothetical protein